MEALCREPGLKEGLSDSGGRDGLHAGSPLCDI